MQQYRLGDIQTAKQALLDYLRVVEEEEASDLPFSRTAWTKAVTSARLTLIYRDLGDTRLANKYLEQAVAYAKKDARDQRNSAWAGKADEQLEILLIDAVNKLDDNTRPNWRRSNDSTAIRSEHN